MVMHSYHPPMKSEWTLFNYYCRTLLVKINKPLHQSNKKIQSVSQAYVRWKNLDIEVYILHEVSLGI